MPFELDLYLFALSGNLSWNVLFLMNSLFHVSNEHKKQKKKKILIFKT